MILFEYYGERGGSNVCLERVGKRIEEGLEIKKRNFELF